MDRIAYVVNRITIYFHETMRSIGKFPLLLATGGGEGNTKYEEYLQIAPRGFELPLPVCPPMLCCIHYNIPVYIRAALEEQYAKTEANR